MISRESDYPRDGPCTDVEDDDGGGDESPLTWKSEADGHLVTKVSETETGDHDENASLKVKGWGLKWKFGRR